MHFFMFAGNVVSEFSYRCSDGFIHKAVYNRNAQLSTIYYLDPKTGEERGSLTLLLKDEQYHHKRVCNDFNNKAILDTEKLNNQTKDIIIKSALTTVKYTVLASFSVVLVGIGILSIVFSAIYRLRNPNVI